MAKKAVVKAFLGEVLGVPELQAEIDSCKVEHLISQPTGEQLVHFMRFLLSGDPLAREVLAHFRTFHDRCPDSKTCEVCNGHCLIEELQRAGL
jgi:Mn-dependent DtxR family transcriptional regulator